MKWRSPRPCVLIQRPLDDAAQLTVVGAADVLEHADRDERVAATVDLRDSPRRGIGRDRTDPSRSALFAGPADLFSGDVVRANAHAVMLRHVKGQRPHPHPASTTVSPGRRPSLRQTCSIFATWACSERLLG